MVKFLTAINAGKTNTFSMLVVRDFDGVAVEDGDDGAGEVSEGGVGGKKDDETCQQ